MMSTTSATAREIYVKGLRNQHESRIRRSSCSSAIGRLENYPEMADRMRQHLEESKTTGCPGQGWPGRSCS
jgi:hypothetical protein